MTTIRSTIHNIYKSNIEKVLPVRSQSAFREKGVLTPEEFVIAGDYLVRTCPTWSWEAGDSAKAKPYLPADKQYLVTRNVPCYKRASVVESYGVKADDMVETEGDGDGWVATHKAADGPGKPRDDDNLPSLSEDGQQGKAAADTAGSGVDNDDDVPDIDALELEDDAEQDEAAVPQQTGYLRAQEPEEDILKTRTYDLSISYDKYYSVPRFWLVGYDEHRQPLKANQMLEDVSEEHARKTITVETFPHGANTAASIHPCLHSNVMKRFGDIMCDNGKDLRVDQYMLLFVKFIASVVPTIEYDYTMPAGLL